MGRRIAEPRDADEEGRRDRPERPAIRPGPPFVGEHVDVSPRYERRVAGDLGTRNRLARPRGQALDEPPPWDRRVDQDNDIADDRTGASGSHGVDEEPVTGFEGGDHAPVSYLDAPAAKPPGEVGAVPGGRSGAVRRQR